jgi:NADH dehydrogenase (ubiquinone) 1 alpha subcomplex subunit 9
LNVNVARSGAQIVIPYRGEESSYTHLKVMGDVGQIVPLAYSIRDDDLIAKAVSRSNIVVNLLGKRTDTRNFKLEELHITAAEKIAKAAKAAGVERFIQISTVNSANSPNSKWATTKYQGEEAVKEVFPEATIIRATTIFGNQDWFLNRFGYFCRWLPFIPLLFNQHSKIQPLYVRDVASALIAILADQNSFGKTFELGGPDVYTFRELLDQIVFEYAKIEHGRVITLPHDLAK